MTDKTFEPIRKTLLPKSGSDPFAWVGKCIHCNTKLFVTDQGNTEATVEHIRPLCAGGDPFDPRNLALACSRCNNAKGIHHDQHVGKGGRADEVIASLQSKRDSRWRPMVQPEG